MYTWLVAASRTDRHETTRDSNIVLHTKTKMIFRLERALLLIGRHHTLEHVRTAVSGVPRAFTSMLLFFVQAPLKARWLLIMRF